MKKIRINELARELEVKAHEILDRLPELGVAEKKTHSSSIDEDVAIKLRRLYGFEVPESYEAEEPAADETAELEAEAAKSEGEQPAAEPETAPALGPGAPALGQAEEAPAATGKLAEEHRPAAPLRPPLAGGRPIQPPVAGLRPGPAEPARPAPAAPSGAVAKSGAPPAAVIAPGRPAAPSAKPLPTTPRPGQVLSGPRQPFRGGRGSPRNAGGAASPRTERRAPRSESPSSRTGAPAPAAMSVPAVGRPLAGQPAARPVVPPRPDLVAKLATPRPVMPAQPAAPGRGYPRRASAPAPGQPIYRGPIRPGQPLVAKPGVRPGVPSQSTVGPRPQHPTSPRGARLEPGMAPPPVGSAARAPRRQAYPRASSASASRKRRILRPATRRQVESGPPPISREITISEGITVKELSEKLDVKAAMVIKKLMDRGIFGHHQPDAGRQAGHRNGARVRRIHRHGELRSGSHAGRRGSPKSRRTCRSAPPW